MNKAYVQPGEVLDYTAGANIANGDVVVIGTKVAVALMAIPNGTSGSVAVWGVWKITKKAGDTFVQGALVYWDATNKYMTSTASGNTLAGYASAPAAGGDAVVAVKINA